MNIFLTGAAGQLGNELLPLLSAIGNVVATDLRTPPGASKQDWVGMDISNAGKLETLLNRLRPELIVNTAAYTAVDQAESNPETCFAINATLPQRLAAWTRRNDAHLIHYSTDYVFDGKSRVAYLETDRPDPQNVYGDSKLAGETAVAASACKHAILRSSWVYSSHGKNFVLSMLDLARKGLALKIVNDQRGCPTWARNLALASEAVIRKWQDSDAASLHGVFHYCDDQDLSWYDFAQQIFSLAIDAGLLESKPELTPVPSSEFPQPAERPKWSVLDAQKIGKLFAIHPVSFEQSLHTVIAEIKTKDYL